MYRSLRLPGGDRAIAYTAYRQSELENRFHSHAHTPRFKDLSVLEVDVLLSVFDTVWRIGPLTERYNEKLTQIWAYNKLPIATLCKVLGSLRRRGILWKTTGRGLEINHNLTTSGMTIKRTLAYSRKQDKQTSIILENRKNSTTYQTSNPYKFSSRERKIISKLSPFLHWLPDPNYKQSQPINLTVLSGNIKIKIKIPRNEDTSPNYPSGRRLFRQYLEAPISLKNEVSGSIQSRTFLRLKTSVSSY